MNVFKNSIKIKEIILGEKKNKKNLLFYAVLIKKITVDKSKV